MKLPFDPAKNGWHFPANIIADAMGVKRTDGLCGGMSLSAVNYFRYGMNIPAVSMRDIKKANPVSDFILYSQFAVFESPNIMKQKAELLFTNTEENHYRSSINDEFPKIKKALDDGCFVMLGLRSKENFKTCHQTLVYGYDDRNYILYMYDSEFPNQETVVRSNGYRLTFSNGKAYSSYFLLMSLNPAAKSDLNAYDIIKNPVYNFAVKPPQA